jgi:type II secretory pathway component PulM
MMGRFIAALKALNQRERMTIISGAALLGVVLFYLYAWEPMRKQTATLRDDLPGARRTAEWMRLKKPEVERLKSAVDKAVKTGADVAAFTQQAFDGSGVEGLAVQALDIDKVSVTAGAIEPKKLFTIIGKLRKEGMITVSAIRIEALPDGKIALAEGVFVRAKGDGA